MNKNGDLYKAYCTMLGMCRYVALNYTMQSCPQLYPTIMKKITIFWNVQLMEFTAH